MVVIITQPQSQRATLQLCSHKSVKLQGGTQACAFLTFELNLLEKKTPPTINPSPKARTDLKQLSPLGE